MSSFHIRPRFEQILEAEANTLRAQIVDRVQAQGDRFEVKNFPGFVCLRIHENERHFWSPRLNLGIEALGPGQTVVRGVYGPNANVWSLFMLGYLIVGLLATFSGVVALCQWKIGVPIWGVWPFAAAIVVLIALYIVAQIGQKLGAQQTFTIHQAYEAAVHQHVEIH